MNIDVFHHLDLVRKAVVSLPCVEEYTCFQTPAFRVKKKLLARVREDGETLAVHAMIAIYGLKLILMFSLSLIITATILLCW